MAEIVSTPKVLGGKPRIEGRRISVLHVVDRIQSGRTPEEVTTQFDLTLGEVYTALAYYHEHPEEMRELRQQIAERVREHRRDSYHESRRFAAQKGTIRTHTDSEYDYRY